MVILVRGIRVEGRPPKPAVGPRSHHHRPLQYSFPAQHKRIWGHHQQQNLTREIAMAKSHYYHIKSFVFN